MPEQPPMWQCTMLALHGWTWTGNDGMCGCWPKPENNHPWHANPAHRQLPSFHFNEHMTPYDMAKHLEAFGCEIDKTKYDKRLPP